MRIRQMSQTAAVRGRTTPQERLSTDHRLLGSWHKVAAKYEVSVGTAHRVGHGHVPLRPDLRKKLGFEDKKFRIVIEVDSDGNARIIEGEQP